MPYYNSVAIIIVTWNNYHLTRKCLHSVQKNVYQGFRIIVVDNGSTDETPKLLSNEFPTITLLTMNRNAGFSSGANEGIRHAMKSSYPFIWVLNNDVTVERYSLSSLMDIILHDQRIGMAGSVLVEHIEGKEVMLNGGKVNFFTGIPSNVRRNSSMQLDYMKGASILLRSQALKEVGLFDELFFLYWEDTDLAFRMRANGWKLAIAHDSVILHEGHGSLKYRSVDWDYHFTLSSILFFFKHAPFPPLPIVVSVIGRIVMRLFQKRPANALAVVKAFLTGISKFTTARRGRLCQ